GTAHTQAAEDDRGDERGAMMKNRGSGFGTRESRATVRHSVDRGSLLVGAMGMSCAFAIAPIVATAQSSGPIPAAAYQAMRWRLVGPSRGGRALAIEGIPGDPATFYFGAVAGGVWRTRNAGETWQPLTDAQPFASVGALAIAPSDPNTIY